MPRVLIASLFVLGLLASCADFPDLDAAISDRARKNGFPTLVDLSGLVETAQDEGNTAELAANLAARAANLRARAARMQGPVVDNRTRRRMEAALRRHSG